MTAWTDKKFSTLAGYMGKLKLSQLFGIINMWSYYKPTDGSTYGITPASISLSSLTSNYNKAWTGNAVAASHKRLSKFSSYNHTMAAPVSAFSVTGSPYTSSEGGDCVTFTADVNLAAATADRVDLGDVLGSGFYFAVRCIGSETHTARCSTSISDGGKQITFNTSGWTAGSYACYPFITNSDYSVCYSMPNVSSDSITVTQYVAPAPSVTGIKIYGYSGAIDINESFTLVVHATYSDGTEGTENIATANMWSGYSNYFNISGTGTFTAKAFGSCTITATYSGYTASITATVSVHLLRLSITGPSTAAVDSEFTLALYAHYSDDTSVRVTSGHTWSGYGSIATLGSDDTFTATRSGSATIVGSYGGKTASWPMTISKKLLSIYASSSSARVAIGESFTITIYGTYYDGLNYEDADITSSVTWSNYSTILTRSGNTFTGKAAGSAFVRAEYGGRAANIGTTVTGTPTVKIYQNGADVTGSTVDVIDGSPVELTAQVSGVTASQYSWASSNNGVVRIASASSATCTASYRSDGTATITLTVNGNNSLTASVTVRASADPI